MKERMLSAIAMTRLSNGNIGKIDGIKSIIRQMANLMNDSNAEDCKYPFRLLMKKKRMMKM